MQTYIVQAGDTLYGISKQFGVSVEEIKNANKLVNNNISVGKELLIPTSSTTTLYIIRKGDTLYSIARNYSVSVNDLISINNLSNTNLIVGEQIRIPVNSTSNNNNYVSYKVVSGDTLYSISKKFGVSVESIKSFNSLNNNNLSLNSTLLIPVDSVSTSYDIYIVRSGDTVYSISKKYGISVDELIKLNNLTTTSLYIGEVLKVPVVNEEIAIGSSCYGIGYTPNTYVTYKVVKGDSLWTISRKFSVSIDSLIKLNNLTSNNLSVGQVLKIKESI